MVTNYLWCETSTRNYILGSFGRVSEVFRTCSGRVTGVFRTCLLKHLMFLRVIWSMDLSLNEAMSAILLYIYFIYIYIKLLIDYSHLRGACLNFEDLFSSRHKSSYKEVVTTRMSQVRCKMLMKDKENYSTVDVIQKLVRLNKISTVIFFFFVIARYACMSSGGTYE